MAAQKVNVAIKKTFSLKKLAKRRKMQGGDAGVLSDRILNRNK